MRNKGKKILGLTLATLLLGSTMSLAGCGSNSYKGDKLTPGYVSDAEVTSNGGFLVEKGEYVYFINGVEGYTAKNKYGKVVKGALMRISKTELNGLLNGEDVEAQIVVPSLFVQERQQSGIYIYGDYVYYATPTTDTDDKGNVENSWIDVKRAKIDGSEAPMKGEYLQRSSATTTVKRFVTVDGVDEDDDGELDVFCLYEENGSLKSYNTATDKKTTLVSGAKSSFFYNEADPTDPTVYYTMGVTEDADQEISNPAKYDQIYSVNAAAKVEKYDSADGQVSYTVKGGRTYSFDEDYFDDNDLSTKDYTDFPYVNLGTLVADGIGFSSQNKWTQFNNEAENWINENNEEDLTKKPLESLGFNYTIKRVANGGVYFTKTSVATAGNDADTNLYYLPTERAEGWSAIKDSNEKADVVLTDATKTYFDSALYSVKEEAGVRTHSYFYVDGNKLMTATAGANGVADEFPMAEGEKISGISLWQVKGDYLYFFGSGTNGNNVSRINATGDEADYKWYKEEYEPQTLACVDWNSSWYKPEFVGDVLLYSNAQSYGGSTAYNYIYATKVGTTEEIIAANEAYTAYTDYFAEYSTDPNTQNLIKYFFMTDGVLEQEVIDQYDETIYNQVVEKFADSNAEKLSKQKDFNVLVSRMTKSDAEEIEDGWKSVLKKPPEATVIITKLATWVIVLIVIGCALLLTAAVLTPLLIILHKKKVRRREEEATTNAYKRKKIDMTKDDTIDVYADEEAETENAEEKEE